MTIAMKTAAPAARAGSTLESDARAWIDDPLAYFGKSTTRAHSFPRRDAEAIQLAAMNILLEERRAQIPVLAKLADGQGISRIDSLNDAAPLLFAHSVYKSYPVSLLAKQRFDQLTQWLGRLTPHDLSGVDVSKCASIDDWLVVLREQTALDVGVSSGTSGMVSFFPKSKRDYTVSVGTMRMQATQTFGTAPSDADLHGKLHVIIPGYRDGHSSASRFSYYFGQVFGFGDEAYLHTAYPFKLSTDLMWLSSRLRAAAAKGDATRVDVPANLLARREEMEKMFREMPAQQEAFINAMVKELKGQRVFIGAVANMFYEVARRGLDEGMR